MGDGKRWWLYKCEVCGVAVFSNQDHGNVWYNDCCGICKTWTYYDKMVIHKTVFVNLEDFTKCPSEDMIVFMSKGNLEEQDDSSE